MNGSLVLIIVAHAPYLRAAGREPKGEAALHDLIAGALVPAIRVLADLRDAGVRPRIGLAISPILLEQLADAVVQKHVVVATEARLRRMHQVVAGWERDSAGHAAYLGRFLLQWEEDILRTFAERFRRNLATALRELVADGLLEPLASAATHAYLPLLGSEAAVRAQIEAGLLATTQRLGVRPRGVWLPECGFHPRLLAPLRASGAEYSVIDPASLPRGAPGPHLAYELAPGLAALVRDAEACVHVWTPALGYPGDALYRAPARDPGSGLPLWRHGLDHDGELYDPYHAFRRAEEHAAHFLAAVAARLADGRERGGPPGICLVPLGPEVLGLRWFEGPVWLRALIEQAAAGGQVALRAPGEALRLQQRRPAIVAQEGSWGVDGSHRAWSGAAAFTLWQALHEAEERVAELARRFPDAGGVRERALNQAARELLLAQSSDWPLRLGSGAAGEALARPAAHLRRCEQLCALAERADAAADADRSLLDELEELDNPFPALNYRVFQDESAAMSD
jgi:1,4-alpha-glucan branching enzyme